MNENCGLEEAVFENTTLHFNSQTLLTYQRALAIALNS